jgi:hypothetical protein
MALILDSCCRRASTAGELQEALGAPPKLTPLLRRGEPLSDLLLIAARPDILYQAGCPRFVEFNIDGALGGTLHADLLAARYMNIFGALGCARDLTAPASSVDARFAEMRESLDLAEGALVAIPVFREGANPGLEDPSAFLAWLEPMCESGRRVGLDPVGCLMDQLNTGSSDELRLEGRRVDAVFRLFLSFDQPPGPGTAAIARAVQAGTVAMHTPEATWLLSDKTTVAWVWEDRELLTPEDQRLIDRHVPRTTMFPAPGRPLHQQMQAAQEHRRDLVLKPAADYGGTGVVIGHTVTEEHWHAALADAASAGRHVLQDYVIPDRTTVLFVDQETGETEHAEAPFVVGPYLFGDRPSGVLVRHGEPGRGLELNARTGASMNTALLTRPPN